VVVVVELVAAGGMVGGGGAEVTVSVRCVVVVVTGGASPPQAESIRVAPMTAAAPRDFTKELCMFGNLSLRAYCGAVVVVVVVER
jgi:hypothetical protein